MASKITKMLSRCLQIGKELLDRHPSMLAGKACTIIARFITKPRLCDWFKMMWIFLRENWRLQLPLLWQSLEAEDVNWRSCPQASTMIVIPVARRLDPTEGLGGGD